MRPTSSAGRVVLVVRRVHETRRPRVFRGAAGTLPRDEPKTTDVNGGGKTVSTTNLGGEGSVNDVYVRTGARRAARRCVEI